MMTGVAASLRFGAVAPVQRSQFRHRPRRHWRRRRMHTPRRSLFGGGLLAVILVSGACSNDATVTSGAPSPSTTVAATPALPTFAAGTTMAAIQARGKLIVGTRLDLTGFGVKNAATGAMEGFDVEIAKLIATAIFGGTPADVVG